MMEYQKEDKRKKDLLELFNKDHEDYFAKHKHHLHDHEKDDDEGKCSDEESEVESVNLTDLENEEEEKENEINKMMEEDYIKASA